MSDWRWVGETMIYAVHDRQLAEHGGLPGVRDAGAISSALARPVNLAAYGDPSAADLAAAYAYGLARNHGFADGNKRTAWLAARIFLADNGFGLRFDQTEATLVMEPMAAGQMAEFDLAGWFARHLT